MIESDPHGRAFARSIESLGLFPTSVFQHTVVFDLDDSTDPAERFPGVAVPPALSRAVRKRQVEFLAGRHCAREALRTCMPEHADFVVGSGRQGAPLWPPGVVGSITHGHGFAAAALARDTQAHALGLDAEEILSDERAEAVVDSVAAPGELTVVARATGWSRATALTAIFSAKETIFKCLYADVGRYFGFLDAHIDAFDRAAGTFDAHLVTSIAPGCPAGRRLSGRFAFDPHRVHTAMLLPP